ncbi:transcription factor IIIB [Arabidopsis thaliana]|jgi:uncharacterized protein YqgV (UPF0045/DUF77 family)|uniref:AT4g17010/dl4535w n=3 Tax=Arabidopsis thaliana TaxID=3702 RepID=Q94AX0_ARATH|nr:transcription factor IIIB [Arabidopsis thaliana]AAK74009.1 AT4g17010/dl4535w [Arabidopsis thaliana]AAL31154.1 AT4g17010/dl4535w [Arabidopsis thaliana]AEE83837.1 transcription factor IIIB [Arabidopsis thaliana]|eukprot:NP_567520.1 transcription factor IIIB [Arabidopsis thaliana]
MNKLLEYGRKAMFYVRVLSGYEERRIRSYRLQLEKRIQQANQRKVEINRLPEQIVLSEVRRMVEEMQNLNKQIENTEAQIEDYFKPIDKHASTIMEIQLEGEKKTMGTMMNATQQEAIRKIEEAEKLARARGNANVTTDANMGDKIQDSESSANEKSQAK